MQKKTLIWIAIIIFLVFLLPSRTVFALDAAEPSDAESEEKEASAEETLLEGTGDVIDDLDLSGIEDLYENASKAFGGVDLQQAIKALSKEGLTDLTVEQAINAVLAGLKDSLFGNWKYIAEILSILFIMSILKNLKSSFGESGVSEAATWAGYIMVGLLASAILIGCIGTAKNAMDTLGAGVESLTPILMVLLTGMGDLSSSAVLSPIMGGLTGGIFILVEKVIFPAILAGAVISLASGISNTLRLAAFSKLIESGVKWLLGILFVVFLGVTALKGLAGASLDGVYFKTAKYTVDKMVPVIGSMFSDTLETVMACSLIVKNAVGIVGLIALTCAIGVPLLSLMANMLLMRVGAAGAELFSDNACSGLLRSMSSTIQLLFLTLLTLLAMVFIYIAMVMGVADISAMVR